MATQTIRLITLLKGKGYSDEEAGVFVDAIITKDAAKEELTTKSDLRSFKEHFDNRINSLYMNIAVLFVGQVAVFIAIVTWLVA